MAEFQLQTPQMNTIYCSCCSVQLSYPTGSMYIQCPKCRNTMNPQAPQQTNCINCSTLLAHPPNSLYIQCPKCLVTMNAREQPRALFQSQFMQQQYPSMQNSKPAKKRKDPNAPKAASNAYMIFCKNRRQQLKIDFPDLPFGQLGAKLGELWRTLTPEQKKPFEDQASADRERYRKDMEEYQASHDLEQEAAAKRQRIDAGGVGGTDETGMYSYQPGQISQDPQMLMQQQQMLQQPQQFLQNPQPDAAPGSGSSFQQPYPNYLVGDQAPNSGTPPAVVDNVSPAAGNTPGNAGVPTGGENPIIQNERSGILNPEFGGIKNPGPSTTTAPVLESVREVAGAQQTSATTPSGSPAVSPSELGELPASSPENVAPNTQPGVDLAPMTKPPTSGSSPAHTGGDPVPSPTEG
eukprot:43997_1